MYQLHQKQTMCVSGGTNEAAEVVGFIGGCVGAALVFPFALLMAGFASDSYGGDSYHKHQVAQAANTLFMGIEALGFGAGYALGYVTGALGEAAVTAMVPAPTN